MKKDRTLLPVVLGALAAVGAAGYFVYSSSRASVENARYRVLRQDGPFEIREYPALRVARTSMRSTREDDDAFLRLFRFIDRGNLRQEKIPMTAPVFLDDRRTMSFVLPEAVAPDAPPPAADDVEIVEREATQVAVYRYRGNMKEAGEEAALVRLREWTTAENLPVAGDPIIAYYDAPFIPGFLRRNEVMLRLPADYFRQ